MSHFRMSARILTTAVANPSRVDAPLRTICHNSNNRWACVSNLSPKSPDQYVEDVAAKVQREASGLRRGLFGKVKRETT